MKKYGAKGGKYRQYKKYNKLKRYKQATIKDGLCHRKIEVDVTVVNYLNSGQASFSAATSTIEANIYTIVNNNLEFIAMKKLYSFFRVNGISITYQSANKTATDNVPFYVYVDFSSPVTAAVNTQCAVASDQRLSCNTNTTNNQTTKYWPAEKDLFCLSDGNGAPTSVYGGRIWNDLSGTLVSAGLGKIIIGQQILGVADTSFGVLQVKVYMSFCKPVLYSI
jgi:hypothetical protein